MLTILVLLDNLGWLVPTTFMMGCSPAFMMAAMTWRCLTVLLPNWLYVKGDDFLFSTYQRQVLFCFEKLSGTQLKFYGDTDAVIGRSGGENSLFMSNHQCTVDWVIAEAVAMRRGSLGRVRYILKDGLRYLPLYGWYFAMHGCLFVKKGTFQKSSLDQQLSKACESKKPMWLVIFPEGTRLNPEMTKSIENSKKFSKSQGVPPFSHVLHPRTRGFHTCLQGLRDSVESVYDVTVAYSSTKDFKNDQRMLAPSMQEFLLGKCRQVHIHVARIPMAEVPVEEEALTQWLVQRYQEKDKLLAHFYSAAIQEEAKFPGESVSQPLSLASLLPSVCLWSGTFLAKNLCEETRYSYWRSGAVLSIIGVAWMGIRK